MIGRTELSARQAHNKQHKSALLRLFQSQADFANRRLLSAIRTTRCISAKGATVKCSRVPGLACLFFFENSRTGEHKSAMSACKYSNYTRSAVNITRSRGENTKVRKACTDAWMYRKIYLVFACFVAIFQPYSGLAMFLMISHCFAVLEMKRSKQFVESLMDCVWLLSKIVRLSLTVLINRVHSFI